MECSAWETVYPEAQRSVVKICLNFNYSRVGFLGILPDAKLSIEHLVDVINMKVDWSLSILRKFKYIWGEIDSRNPLSLFDFSSIFLIGRLCR